uniref:Uncharacterized protein n=1 Tax=Oryza nivara TaxID=4536 RepID=A0A0E0H0C5_ORYNI
MAHTVQLPFLLLLLVVPTAGEGRMRTPKGGDEPMGSNPRRILILSMSDDLASPLFRDALLRSTATHKPTSLVTPGRNLIWIWHNDGEQSCFQKIIIR